MYKNVASQKVAVFAWDTSADSEKTGDAGNITAQISLDGGATAPSNDANPTELDATDAPGVYLFDVLQGETDADLFVLFAKSSTGNIKIEPVIAYTLPGDSTALAADMIELVGGAQSATDLKDFADAGYDPGTNKVQGVVLVDTTTTNSDMVAEAPTAAAVVNEWESQSQLDPTGFHVNVLEVEGGDATDALEAAATASLVAHNLDHLALTATAGADMTAEVADDTVLSRMLANGNTSDFVPSTDGLQPIRDRGDAAWDTATVVDLNADQSGVTIGTVTTNTDVRGTDNAALASVLGALNDAAAADDPTNADTAIQYLKQLVNVLVGTAGVATFPAEAAPANGVSLAEVLRAVYVDTTEIGVAGAGLTNINLPNQAMDVTGNITGNLSGSVGSVAGAVGSVAGNVDGNVAGSVGSLTTNNDKTGYSLSAAAIQAIWDALTSALTTAGSIGKLLVDNINATISSRSSHTAANVWAVAVRVLTAGTNLNDISTAEVNAEVLNVMNVDTFAEPGQGAPAETTTIFNKIGFLYKAFRNRIIQTDTTLSIFADDATTVDQKATVSDDTVTYDRGEIGTGP